MEESKILSCAWKWSEGSGDNYVFPKEVLLSFAKELLSLSLPVEQGTAQDEREAFEAWAAKRGLSLVKYAGGMYVSDCTMWANIVWQERASRTAQTEQGKSALHRAITHYEAALQAAFPSGSPAHVSLQWDEARRQAKPDTAQTGKENKKPS